jgi:hypothetical protein
MSIPILRYNPILQDSDQFRFINLGSIDFHERRHIVAYELDKKSMTLILPLDSEVFDVVDYCDPIEISFQLMNVFEKLIGCSSIFENPQFKSMRLRMDVLVAIRVYVSQIIKEHWNIQYIKSYSHVIFVRNILKHVLVEEADRRYKSQKAKIIQKHWRIAIANPEYTLCFNRLMRESNELVNTI